MALEEYRRKRDFKRTPEPAPGRIETHQAKLAYLIQKHDATRLHYDFRLELDGVLLSWAVTKGPSLNPSDKRLAVRTEDHPLSYGTFEGTIPKGQYGGGSVMLWDNGTWEPRGDPRAGLRKGHLSLLLHGERLKGGWDLIRMRDDQKRENWLLIKEDDHEAKRSAKAASLLDEHAVSVKTGRTMDEIAAKRGEAHKADPPAKASAQSATAIRRLMERYPEVQLATLVDKAPEGDQWLHEIKFDGYRLLGFMAGNAARLRTRNGKDWTERFPTLAAALTQLKVEDAVIDMEAVVLNADGRSLFQSLQAALGEGGDPDQISAYVFDLLYLNREDLTDQPLIDRKERLRNLLPASDANGALRFAEHVLGHGEALFARGCKTGLEGIVSKQADAPYRAGRQRSWLKIKCGRRQEFIILGFSDARKGSRALGALYLGYRNGKELRYAGKVGTGFTMRSARELVEKFNPLEARQATLSREDAPGLPAAEWQSIHWIKPLLLCEVAFAEWTEDGHVRHPSFQGLREDKDIREVTKEKPVPTRRVAVKQDESTRDSHPPNESGSLILAGVTITHPDRVISETGHVTKGEVAQYYAGVAPILLPQLARRPLSILRCPGGIDEDCFYQRNPGKGLGSAVRTFVFQHKGKEYNYLYIENEEGLLQLVQMGAIEMSPWGATIDAIDYPDRLIFDLDPSPDVPFEAVKLAAVDLRNRLINRGLQSSLKCTGGKGLHITVPLAGKDKWPEVKSFAVSVANEMVAAAPQAYIATMSKAKRTGKIFIDYLRNDYTATAISDYSIRARPGAPVAVPLDWSELKSLKSPAQFTLAQVLKRIKNKPLVSSLGQSKQTIPT